MVTAHQLTGVVAIYWQRCAHKIQAMYECSQKYTLYNALFLQRSLLRGGIILQGVLLLQVTMSVFACHYG
jgi:hypothetical protein